MSYVNAIRQVFITFPSIIIQASSILSCFWTSSKDINRSIRLRLRVADHENQYAYINTADYRLTVRIP